VVRRVQGVLAVLLACLLLGAGGQAFAAEPLITNSGEDLRTGWYPEASSITPQLVTGGTFGQLWSTPVKGQVYAQPLLADGTLLVATEEDEVYGLNPTTGALKWSKSLGEAWQSAEIECGDLAPSVGVTATPVIDPETGVAYLTHKAYVPGVEPRESRWYMDAISVTTGAEQPGFPVEISGTAQNASCSDPDCCCWKASYTPGSDPIATTTPTRAGCSASPRRVSSRRAGPPRRTAAARGSGSRAQASCRMAPAR
jgi:hypothetical protein